MHFFKFLQSSDLIGTPCRFTGIPSRDLRMTTALSPNYQRLPPRLTVRRTDCSVVKSFIDLGVNVDTTALVLKLSRWININVSGSRRGSIQMSLFPVRGLTRGNTLDVLDEEDLQKNMEVQISILRKLITE